MFFKPEDLYAAGQTGSDLVKGLASDVANNVCGLYKNYPRSFGVSNPAGNAVNALASGVWDSFCGRLPTPQTPVAPVVPPAQCSGKSYKCVVTYTRKFSDGTESAASYTTYRCGPISYTLRAMTGVSFGQQEALWTTTGSSSSSSGNCTAGTPTSTVFDNFIKPGTYNVVFSRVDGGADDCGVAEYPNVSAPSTNPKTYGHVGSDGVVRPVNYNINFPGAGLSPTINFPDLPDLNIPIKVDATGIEVNIPVGIGLNDSENGGITDDNLEDILAGAKAATRGARAGNRATNGGGNNEGGTGEDGIEGFYGIYFDAVTIPTWFGKVFGSPVKYRLGRISFKRDGYHLRDEDILFAKQYFIAPSDANGYVATYEPEVVGKITVIREIQE